MFLFFFAFQCFSTTKTFLTYFSTFVLPENTLSSLIFLPLLLLSNLLISLLLPIFNLSFPLNWFSCYTFLPLFPETHFSSSSSLHPLPVCLFTFYSPAPVQMFPSSSLHPSFLLYLSVHLFFFLLRLWVLLPLFQRHSSSFFPDFLNFLQPLFSLRKLSVLSSAPFQKSFPSFSSPCTCLLSSFPSSSLHLHPKSSSLFFLLRSTSNFTLLFPTPFPKLFHLLPSSLPPSLPLCLHLFPKAFSYLLFIWECWISKGVHTLLWTLFFFLPVGKSVYFWGA